VSRFAGNAEAFSNDGEINYRYDRIGNMIAQTSTIDHQEKGLPVVNLGDMDSGGSAGRFNRVGRALTDPPGPHALTRISNLESQISNREYSYDANGNMLDIDGLRCTWDFKDRLVAVENDQMRADYVYDYTDRRIRKRVLPKDLVGTRSTASPQFSSRSAPAHQPAPVAEEGGEAVERAPTSVLYVKKFFEVREHEQPIKYVWNGGSRVARVTGSFSANERVQRLRLHPGWNLISLAVSSTNTAAQLKSTAPPGEPLIQLIYQWNPASKDYRELNGTEGLAAGTVLWLKASDTGTLSLKGSYFGSTTVPVTVGGSYYPAAGFDVLSVSNALPAGVTAWFFVREAQRWYACLTGELNLPSELPEFLAPGEALFVHATAPAHLEMPNPDLRIRYYHQDHLGSSSYLSDGQGNFMEETTCYPFGAVRTNRRQTRLREEYGFAQKESDRESGLHYFEARFFSSLTGRFLSVDPLLAKQSVSGNPQRLNAYSYGLNNPVRMIDPTGQDAVDYLKGLGAGAWEATGIPAAASAASSTASTIADLASQGDWLGAHSAAQAAVAGVSMSVVEAVAPPNPVAIVAGLVDLASVGSDYSAAINESDDFEAGKKAIPAIRKSMEIGAMIYGGLRGRGSRGGSTSTRGSPTPSSGALDPLAKTQPDPLGLKRPGSPAWEQQATRKLNWITQMAEGTRDVRMQILEESGVLEAQRALRDIFRMAEEKFGPTPLRGDYGTYHPKITPAE
jgi:RHS repeat-associated protein